MDIPYSTDIRLADLTKEFHDVRVSTLYAGKSVLIPPGWFHAVITIEDSFMMDCYVFRDDWAEMARDASKLELKFLLSEDAKGLKVTDYYEILERFRQDFILIKQSANGVDSNWEKSLIKLAEEKLEEIKKIDELKKSM